MWVMHFHFHTTGSSQRQRALMWQSRKYAKCPSALHKQCLQLYLVGYSLGPFAPITFFITRALPYKFTRYRHCAKYWNGDVKPHIKHLSMKWNYDSLPLKHRTQCNGYISPDIMFICSVGFYTMDIFWITTSVTQLKFTLIKVNRTREK